VLSFLSFGYATAEFEVTEERLGVYRPEEHIDNPKGYADNQDARKYDARLRGPIQPAELAVDPSTGMKNYIANEQGGWATSAGYVKYSLARSIHFGRVYTNGARGTSGQEADLCEALRCLGQALHCMEVRLSVRLCESLINIKPGFWCPHKLLRVGTSRIGFQRCFCTHGTCCWNQPPWPPGLPPCDRNFWSC
jgi:hypothetical protein